MAAPRVFDLNAAINNKDGVLVVSGDITFTTTPQLAKLANKLLAEAKAVTFDFSAVKELDNSALALLLSWLRYAKNTDKNIRFINVPKQLQDLAKLGGLIDLLPII